jgi:hypothetical protein
MPILPAGMAPPVIYTGVAPSAPMRGAQFIQLADCPTDVSVIAPQQVWLTPDNRGLFLIWGGAFWEGGRGIYIGIDPASSPPQEIPGWTRALPGIYVSDKIPAN